MEHQDIDEYIIEPGQEAEPVIVLTGSNEEFEQFCMTTKRDTKTAIAIKQGFQIPMYEDTPIVLYGNYWLNNAYDSPEYKDRMFKIKLRKLDESTKN